MNRLCLLRHPTFRRGISRVTSYALEETRRCRSVVARISVHSHRFGGREFRFANAGSRPYPLRGIFDIPFPRSVRDALLKKGLAEEHRWVPNSGWVTFRGSKRERLAARRMAHAICHTSVTALKAVPDPSDCLRRRVANCI